MMSDLHYRTVSSDHHSATVKTWTDENGDLGYQFTVDGVKIDEGTISDDDE
jgi:hypothetical protein